MGLSRSLSPSPPALPSLSPHLPLYLYSVLAGSILILDWGTEHGPSPVLIAAVQAVHCCYITRTARSASGWRVWMESAGSEQG